MTTESRNVDLRLRQLAENLRRELAPSPDLHAKIMHRIGPSPEHARTPSRSARRRPLRLAAVLAAALLLLLVANLGAAYFAPRYGQALAGAPLVGVVSSRLLEAFGLSKANATLFNEVSVSNGHALRLVAGYADGLRTVFFLQVDGKGLTGDPKQYGRHPGEYGVGGDDPESITMTDQFGHKYATGGQGSGTEVILQPLTWPASDVGARLTLHISALTGFWSGQPTEVRGSWTLHATLVQEPSRNLPLPSPIRTGNAVYTFTSIRATSTEMQVRWTVSGPANDEIARSIDQPGLRAPGEPNRAYFSPRLFDEQGHELFGSGWGFEFPKDQPALGDLDSYIHGSGRYRIQLGDALTSPADQRWIVVP